MIIAGIILLVAGIWAMGSTSRDYSVCQSPLTSWTMSQPACQFMTLVHWAGIGVLILAGALVLGGIIRQR